MKLQFDYEKDVHYNVIRITWIEPRNAMSVYSETVMVALNTVRINTRIADIRGMPMYERIIARIGYNI